MHANFQASSSTCVRGGGGGDRRKDECHAIFGRNRIEISKLHLLLWSGRDNIWTSAISLSHIIFVFHQDWADIIKFMTLWVVQKYR